MSTTKIATNLPRSSRAMSTTPSPTSAPRASRFTEGSPLTGPEVLEQDDSYQRFLFSTLSEMDEHERRRQRSHRDSNSSTESFNSLSHSSNSSPSRENYRRSMPFGKRSIELVRQSFEDVRNGGADAGDKARGFKGRLRALTGGRERSGSVGGNVKAYTGT